MRTSMILQNNMEKERSRTELSHDGDFLTDTSSTYGSRNLENVSRKSRDSSRIKNDLIKKFCSVGTSHDSFRNAPRVFTGNE